MGKKKLSRAEIQRNYRQRLLHQDPEKAREKERKRWHTRRSQKKVKGINDVSERVKRNVRRRWRAQKAAYRMRVKSTQALTPPESSDEGIQDGRKKWRKARLAYYTRIKNYRRMVAIKKSLQSERSAKEKYKKRWLRLKMCQSSSRASTSTSTSSHNACRSLSTEMELAEVDLDNCSSSASKQLNSQHGNKLDVETKRLVEEFLIHDDNSRMTTGKRQTVTKNKVK